VLPEYFCLMGRQGDRQAGVRENFGAGAVQDFLAQQAKALGLWIVGGTMPLAAGDERTCATPASPFRRRASAWRATTRSTCSSSTTAASSTTSRA
jgi:hypothetical protein